MTQKWSAVNGNPLDAPNLRTCCHFAHNNQTQNVKINEVPLTAPPRMPQNYVHVVILLKTMRPKIRQEMGCR